MKRPRVVLGAQHFEPGVTGIARVARLTLAALAEHHDVQAFAAGDAQEHSVAGVRPRVFGGSRFRFAWAVNRALSRADMAIYDFSGTGRAHLLPGVPYVVWVHGNEIWNEGSLREDYRRVIANAALILANSAFTLAALRRAVAGLPPAKVCWLATEQAHPAPRAIAGPPTLLFVGHSYDAMAKGQDILVRIWPQVLDHVPQARLAFVGGGVNSVALAQIVQASPARASIDIHGFVPEHEMGKVWQCATALALLGRQEGFGLVMVEAMRHGLPVVTSTQDAGCEINLDGVTGFNVDRTNEAHAVDRIVALLSDPTLAKRLGQHGLERWRRFFAPEEFNKRFLATLAEIGHDSLSG